MKLPIKKYLLAGLLVWLPLAITIWVLHWLVGLLDGVFLGMMYGLDSVIPVGGVNPVAGLRDVPGLGVGLILLLLLLTGALVSNVAGRWLVRQGDR